MFTDGDIHDVIVRDIVKYRDSRGWLAEIFRQDEVDPTYHPVMQYISVTDPGVVRGPHEHVDQSDYFAFLGPSMFRLFLWDVRKASPTFGRRQVFEAGLNRPLSVIIPPGVVHAYKNIGAEPGMVVNLPNRLFAGWGKKEKVDEIRHENDLNTPFIID